VVVEADKPRLERDAQCFGKVREISRVFTGNYVAVGERRYQPRRGVRKVSDGGCGENKHA